MAKKHTIILNDLRSAHNVGSIFRTADAAGVQEILLVGTTPTPVDRFGRKQKEITKTALGAEDSVDWRYIETIETAIQNMRKEDVRVVAVEQDKTAKDYRSLEKETPSVFVFGNEVDGLPKEVLDESDHIVEIPMHGMKESLNISVAVGVVLFFLQD